MSKYLGRAPLGHGAPRPDDSPDFYPTPPVAVNVLLRAEIFFGLEAGTAWEPACGEGHISEALLSAGWMVVSSDLIDRGYKKGSTGCDFLDSAPPLGLDAIITNPPYVIAEAFVRHALKNAPYVAMLLQLGFLGSQTRARLFKDHPPSRVWVFAKPLPHWRDGAWVRGSFTHAWFVWDRQKAEFNSAPELRWLVPGEMGVMW